MNLVNWPSLCEMMALHTKDFSATRVHGGNINEAWHLSAGQHSFFVKTNHHSRLAMFEAEQKGLIEIQASSAIRVPVVYGCGIDGDHSFILMEYLNLSGGINERIFAQQLAAMHNHTNNQFGFEIDNTIGTSPQTNRFTASWVDFWCDQRLGLQLKLARENGLDNGLIDAGERLNERIQVFYSDYQPVASLLHGDLWSGNQAADDRDNPVIFDPACYYGDHETDLAMMELFGRPSRQFFDVYHEVFAIDRGYSIRRDLYNLYHILNHANLFGGDYAASAQRMIDTLLAQT
ncbi:MAG: fructosamine kinase family protein [Gammaproteobacteria bacterium]|nr:fructosamine kinase family protein [Gammaproteobacteria bacterium]